MNHFYFNKQLLKYAQSKCSNLLKSDKHLLNIGIQILYEYEV